MLLTLRSNKIFFAVLLDQTKGELPVAGKRNGNAGQKQPMETQEKNTNHSALKSKYRRSKQHDP